MMKVLVLVISLVIINSPFATASDSLTVGEKIERYALGRSFLINMHWNELGCMMGFGDTCNPKPPLTGTDSESATAILHNLELGRKAVFTFAGLISLMHDCDCVGKGGCLMLTQKLHDIRESSWSIKGRLDVIQSYPLGKFAEKAIRDLEETADALEGGISGQLCSKQYVDSMATRYEQLPPRSE